MKTIFIVIILFRLKQTFCAKEATTTQLTLSARLHKRYVVQEKCNFNVTISTKKRSEANFLFG
jgi:hypothetical protein